MTTTFDPKQFRKALGSFATGVTVVTTRGEDGKDYGLTANSFNSVSMEPPMVLWSLDKKSSSLAVFSATEHFAVHIMAADQEEISNRFAKKGVDKFAGCTPARGHGGIPLLNGCSARFECRVVHRYEGGDHLIMVGEVLNFDSFERPPLAFHGGSYGLVMKKSDNLPDTGLIFGNDSLAFLLARASNQLLAPVRQSLNKNGMPGVEFNILTMLSMGDGRTLAELERLVSFSGVRVTYDGIRNLVERGLVVQETVGGETVVRFTEEGRRYAIELLAIAKAAESDAENDLDYREVQVMSLLLKRVIRSSAAALPEYWQLDRLWRNNHLWQESASSDEA